MPATVLLAIAAVAALASGRPVIAVGVGGVLERVIDGVPGTFYARNEPDALAEAVAAFDALAVDPADCMASARRFGGGGRDERRGAGREKKRRGGARGADSSAIGPSETDGAAGGTNPAGCSGGPRRGERVRGHGDGGQPGAFRALAKVAAVRGGERVAGRPVGGNRARQGTARSTLLGPCDERVMGSPVEATN